MESFRAQETENTKCKYQNFVSFFFSPNANTDLSVQPPALVKSVKLINTLTGLSSQQNKVLPQLSKAE